MAVADVMKLIKDNEVKFVDLRFTDTRGKEQHVSVPVKAFTDAKFSDGHFFDGSSIAGWKGIEASDMVLMPDPDSARMDPFTDEPTLLLTCDVIEPSDGKGYDRDPRSIAKRGEAYLKSTGIADTAYFGPEAEFFIFDDVRFDYKENGGFHSIDSVEGQWRMGADERPNLGYKAGFKEGYFPVPPTDHYQDLRTEMVLTLEKVGIPVEAQHHEVATAGQAEIDMRFGPLTVMADRLLMYKYIIKNVAQKHGKTVTLMPKPLFGDNGSGMHTHQSLFKNGDTLMYDAEGYAGISDICRWYIGGLLKHAGAILAFAAPTTNSYKRLVPGFVAPVNLVYSARNRSAAVRIETSSLRTLTCATPSTITGTPVTVYTEGVFTSIVMSSSDRTSAFSSTGQTNVPPPALMRYPTAFRWPFGSVIMCFMPETISTSLGPTFT